MDYEIIKGFERHSIANEHEFDLAAAHCIIVKGALDSSWQDWFDGFNITTQGKETLLSGVVANQSTLHGILAKLNDLGLLIFSFTIIYKDAEKGTK